MKTEIATLCKYASDKNGKLTIVDTIDTISAERFPCHSYFCFVAKINMEGFSVEGETCPLDMFIVGKGSDERLFESSATLRKDGPDMNKLNLVLDLKGLIFKAPGDYMFNVVIGGENVISLPFKVLLADGK